MRRASPSPPTRISDAQLEKMRPHKIDEKLAEHVEWVERMEREPDPGKGLPAKEAETARQPQLKRLESAVGEVDRLRAALPPEPDQFPATHEQERILNRRAIDSYPRSESERKGLRERHEALLAEQHERETKSKLRKLADRRKHPGDPRAASVLAAVISSDFLKDALERKLRSGIRVREDGVVRELADDQYMSVRILEASDVAVIYLSALAMKEGGLLAASEPADRGLITLEDIPESLDASEPQRHPDRQTRGRAKVACRVGRALNQDRGQGGGEGSAPGSQGACRGDPDPQLELPWPPALS